METTRCRISLTPMIRQICCTASYKRWGSNPISIRMRRLLIIDQMLSITLWPGTTLANPTQMCQRKRKFLIMTRMVCLEEDSRMNSGSQKSRARIIADNDFRPWFPSFNKSQFSDHWLITTTWLTSTPRQWDGGGGDWMARICLEF